MNQKLYELYGCIETVYESYNECSNQKSLTVLHLSIHNFSLQGFLREC